MKTSQFRSIVNLSAMSLLVWSSLGLTQAAMANSPFQIAQTNLIRGSAISAFIPNGWSLEKEISGDLNGDGINDRVLQVADRGGKKRSLIVLLSTPSRWKQVASASRLLLCTSCAGMLGTQNGAHIQLQIEDGVLTVKQLAGSRGAIQMIHRFWIDRNSQKFVCIGEDVNPYDRANGNAVNDSRNFLTGKRIVEEYRGRKDRNGKDLVRRRELQVSRQLQPIEVIDIEVVRQSAIELP